MTSFVGGFGPAHTDGTAQEREDRSLFWFAGLGRTGLRHINGLGATVGAEGGDGAEGHVTGFADPEGTNRKVLIPAAVGGEEGADGGSVGEGAEDAEIATGTTGNDHVGIGVFGLGGHL